MLEDVFDEAFMRRLEALHFVAQKLARGEQRAERRSRKLGSGLEFADHRDYAPGDDFRNIDWNVYGRSDRLLVRLFEEEEDLSIGVLLDLSSSMALGEPTKAITAAQIAASIAYLGLAGLDRVQLGVLAEGLRGHLPPMRGKGQLLKVLGFLSNQAVGGQTELESAVKAYVHRSKKRGPTVIISDFYDERGYEAALETLRYHRFEVHVVHIVDENEIEEGRRGEVRLVDCESDQTVDVTLTPALIAEYKRTQARFGAQLEAFCRERQMRYFRAPTSTAPDDLVLEMLKRGSFAR